MRQRLFDSRNPSYWPRLIVTDADRRDDECPPECCATARRYDDGDDDAARPSTGGKDRPAHATVWPTACASSTWASARAPSR